MEGDLIECLNAGDGSWWMGRLRRDKRMVGLFPSNFVQVLEDDFRPVSRATSPLPPVNASVSGTPTTKGGPLTGGSPQKAGMSSFRKPFQAYARAASPNPAAFSPQRGSNSSKGTPRRENSKQRPTYQTSYHQNSPYHSRAPSTETNSVNGYSRPRSSVDQYQFSSPPPPAPPPHRSNVRSNGPQTPRHPSPAPPSPGVMLGNTPSPLRDAMEDVMTSLADMSMHCPPSPTEHRGSQTNPWSPESFGQIKHRKSTRRARPRSSLGIAGEDLEADEPQYFESGCNPQFDDQGHNDQLDQYVAKMETRLRKMQPSSPANELFLPDQGQEHDMPPPPVPSKSRMGDRPLSSLSRGRPVGESIDSNKSTSSRRLKNRKSAYELGRGMLTRTFTNRTNATSSSSGGRSVTTNESGSTQLTSQSLMSKSSAGGVSATSAGSLARKRRLQRPKSVIDFHHREEREGGSKSSFGERRPKSPLTSISFHSSHESYVGFDSRDKEDWARDNMANNDGLGGFAAPKPKKSGFFKKIMESAKTGAASARSSIAAGQISASPTPFKSAMPNGVTSISGSNAAREMGLGSGDAAIDWVQVRRDVNRSNSLSKNERADRRDRCQMSDIPVVNGPELLYDSLEGDEAANGGPVREPTDFGTVNLSLVDKSSRFINSLPPLTNATSLAHGYVCRPYRSDVQRLRAIFTWVSEKIIWEQDFEGDVDIKRVIQTKRGCSEEVAVLVMEMCSAVGVHAEVVRGYLKTPEELPELNNFPNPNHWWNAVVVDGEWRILDCSLASPTNPRRSLFSALNSQHADPWWFLARPTEICFTHLPIHEEQQHMCPIQPWDVLLSLPCVAPPFFKNQLRFFDYDTSLTRLEELDLAHVHFVVPSDTECIAEVEVKAVSRDADGDYFENGDVITKRALAQAEWVNGEKRYIVKALIPGDEGQGLLKVYAGKRGLMHSIRDNPHPLAFSLPITHTGKNPPYEFFTRHPTPHAQRHDLYVAQPQCSRLAANNTFVFAVRQHPSSLVSSGPGSASPLPLNRPSSAMSMTSSQASSQQSSTYAQKKPAKLAIQAPSGKILRLMRKSEHTISTSGPGGGEAGDGGIWETIIKCSERGVWRGLVLADRSARWCVFAEWTCV
ncbi:MAG: cytokinesis protein 3 [Vezdaea aestivalis]|nr:MAG: cytokinesis protein 3 [Vezdaea aestivalis]